MKFSLTLVLFTGLFSFAGSILAQKPSASYDLDAPVLEPSLPEPSRILFAPQQLDPPPPMPVTAQEPSSTSSSRTTEDSYRNTIESFKGPKHQFVHCKLKNGRVLTGTVHDAGYEAFTLKTNILSQGTYIYYKDLAEPPQPVPAVGTRMKQGAQWVGFGILIAAAIPLILIFSPFAYASGWRC